ncbi:MAG: universal stress protein, partial [Rhodomicrobium sp.]
VRGQTAIQQLIEYHNAREAAAAEAANLEFSAAMSREPLSFEFRIIAESDAGALLKLHSLHADLVIAGHPQQASVPPRAAEELLLWTGVPCLVVPEHWEEGTVAKHVLLGWNASREARRAIRDALPLLKSAQAVSVVVVDPEDNPLLGQEPGADVALSLSRHGVNVTVEQIRSEGISIAGAILNHAKRSGADLIVIGAYSHSRFRETLFGGVTRSLLDKTAVPLFIAH